MPFEKKIFENKTASYRSQKVLLIDLHFLLYKISIESFKEWEKISNLLLFKESSVFS